MPAQPSALPACNRLPLVRKFPLYGVFHIESDNVPGWTVFSVLLPTLMPLCHSRPR